MSTIRIIKAPNKPNIRDSLPPTSALRFNPISVLGQKRDRSPLNGNTEPFWNPQKRQRTAIDPDHPIPSREIESWTGGRLEGIPEKPETIIPDSQQSAILGHEDEDNGIVPNLSISNLNVQPDKAPKELVSPFQEPPPRIQGTPKNSAGAKNASYHIQRATNRGRSISTTATSPLTGEPQLPPHSHSNSTKKRKSSETILPGAKSNTPNNRSPRNESDIYDDFGSDTEEPTIRQSKLKFKKDAQKGLSGVETSAKSPSNNNSHPSKTFESISTSNELPLTPKSKVREEALRRRKENEEAAKEARASAAKAAEEHRRESEREAVAAKAERMRKEKSEERKAEEEQKQAARKRKEVAALEVQKLKDEKEKLRKQIEEDDKLEKKASEERGKQAEEESRKSEALENSKVASNTPQGSRKGTPVNKRSTPVVILPRQSSTPHYPRGKKSSLKTSSSSESITSSSPGDPAPKDTSLEAQMPLPSKSPRRVSFDLNETTTPAKPQPKKAASIDTPNKNTTPKLASSQIPAQSQTPIPLPKTFRRPDRSATPVRQQPSKPSAMSQPPLTAARTGSTSRSATPKPVPLPAHKKISTEPKPLQRSTVTPEARKAATSAPGRSLPVKEKSKSPIKPAEVPLPPSSDSSDSSDSEVSDSEEMVSIKEEPKRSISPETLQVEESKNSEDQSDEDIEMGENQSSSRESRSPVVFHSNAPSGDERKSRANFNQTSDSVSSSSEDESSDEEQSEEDANEKQNDPEDKTEIKETQESSEDEDVSDNDDEDVEMPDAPPQRSSPELPSHARRNMVSPIKTTNQPQGSFSSPAKRPTIKPSFNFGASLSSLNSQKGTMFKPKPSTNGQLTKSKLQLSSQMIKKEFSASESEEESDSDDSSDDDDVPIPATSQIIPPSTQNNGFIVVTKKIQDAGSDSDSDSDSGSDDAAAMEEARRSLMAQVHQNEMSASQNNLPQSSQISVNGGVGKGKGETGVLGKANGSAKGSRTAGKEFVKKVRDRITNGYDFKNYGSFN
ncbi:hypothetical protein EAF04_000117 [Stromatinia cepivora]|nr:hypothetical protein EAF04_000117 [Stromatinia cepivora]